MLASAEFKTAMSLVQVNEALPKQAGIGKEIESAESGSVENIGRPKRARQCSARCNRRSRDHRPRQSPLALIGRESHPKFGIVAVQKAAKAEVANALDFF